MESNVGWDLRKLKNFRSLSPYEGSPATSVAFDHSGLYLAVGGPDARVYGVKQDWEVLKTFPDLPKKDWEVLKTFPDLPKKGVHALRFGTDARSLLVGSSDHNLRVFAGPAGEQQAADAGAE
ncbi:hypothetical protein N2152v2_003409 [Parachlorella kessleri]